MIHSIHSELKRMISSKSFKISVILSCIFALGDIVQNIYYKIEEVNDFSVFEKWIGVSDATFAGLAFCWFFPVLASLPYAWTMGEELHNGYAMQVMSRIGRSKYFISKMVAAFISGGIVISAALILNILLLTMLGKTYFPVPNDLISGITSGMFCSTLYYTHPVIFVIIWTLIDFLWGGTIAVLCCSLGFFIKKKIVLVPSIMLIFVGEMILSQFVEFERNGYRIETAWLMLTHADVMCLNPGWVIFGSIGLILLMSVLLIGVKGAKYESV